MLDPCLAFSLICKLSLSNCNRNNCLTNVDWNPHLLIKGLVFHEITMYIFTLRKLALSRENRLHFEVHNLNHRTCIIFVDSPQLEWPIFMGSKRYPAIIELLTLGGTPSQDSWLLTQEEEKTWMLLRRTLSLFHPMREFHTVRPAICPLSTPHCA